MTQKEEAENMEIRTLRAEDNPTIERIIRECLIEFGGNREGLAWEDDSLSALSAFYEGKDREYWVAIEEGRLLGGCGIAPFADSQEVCELQKMYLIAEARGTGAAGMLMRTALDFAAQHYRHCYLETLNTMKAAHRFYRKHGFRELDGPLEGTEHYACDAWYMRPLRQGRTARRVGEMGSSVFSQVFAWQEEAKRLGRDLINLSIGTPDQSPAIEIRQALSRAVLKEDAYSYPGTWGSPQFREQAAAWMKHRFGVEVDPAVQVLPLMGSQDGLAHLAQAICDPGDLAMVPDPGYPIYAGALKLAGVQAHLLPLRREHGFLPNLDDIPEEAWARARFMLVSFPGNPIGARADEAYLTKLIALARKWDVLLVHDLAYSELGFDDYRPMSVLQFPGASDIAVELHSCSKSFNMPGCRVGFLTGNTEAVAALRELKGHLDFGVFAPVQEAAVEAFRLAMAAPEGDRGVAPLYERRRDVFVEALAQEGWVVDQPAATMFLWVELPEPFRRGGRAGSASRFARELVLETGVAVIPGEAFGAEGEGYVRIALVREEEALREAARRIGRFIRGEQ
ncbi:hypothetical protein B9G55_05860 [Saccharibacillus sp. O16]|nr:hypothetical protein B9G55_05860 [Saccharibacillus sp. O16]